MNDATLLLTADRNLRRKFGNNNNGVGGKPDVAGLAAFADRLACEASTDPVTVTSAGSEGAQGAGQITMAREIWLLAAENLLVDPIFLCGGAPQRPPRVILPDYRFVQAV